MKNILILSLLFFSTSVFAEVKTVLIKPGEKDVIVDVPEGKVVVILNFTCDAGAVTVVCQSIQIDGVDITCAQHPNDLNGRGFNSAPMPPAVSASKQIYIAGPTKFTIKTPRRTKIIDGIISYNGPVFCSYYICDNR
jgi:hypothetical protein